MYSTSNKTQLLDRRVILVSCIFFLTHFLFYGTALGQGFLRADGQKIINRKGDNVLLRGIGLGGWMLQEGYMLKVNRDGQQYRIRERIEELIGKKQADEFYESWLLNHTTKADVDSMKAWGFNSIRLPMHYNLYTLPLEKEPVKGVNTWLAKGFAMTDSLLSWCKANQMYLILDLHAAPGGQGNDLNISDRDPSKPSLWDSEANQQKTVALWRKLAERYVSEQWIGGYDIINEPNWGFTDPEKDKNGTGEPTNGPLKKLMVDITRAIREVDKNHLIIIEGNGWGNNYRGILPQWDNNMALSYHKYWNFNDLESIKGFLEAREKYNIPIWLGETGENSNVWFTDAIRLLETNNIGWSWWPLKKVGINNPLEVKSNPNYDRVVNYWNGVGKKPGESDAYSGLMELASALKIRNNVVHRDVIDAMIRQPFSTETKPFKKHLTGPGTIIQAVDYDLGRNGCAYFDKDTANYRVSGQDGRGNRGGAYRNDGVDIRRDSSGYEKYYVSDIEDGEWLQYTIDVERAACYTVHLNIKSPIDTGKFLLVVNGKSFVSNSPIPVTEDLKASGFLEFRNIRLTKGANKVRVYVEKGGMDLTELRFSGRAGRR
ncbi:cellulase (glycosyl hydrolase family 5) [Arcticibacter tournemirensis]|uniref:Cellulase family glycosylhydrolase n=1 Tax=Arcticibacter tournemirensis TaxID=699437 RepID=A0A5M9H9N5_9SPHI|nr:cellulase family glycosylhydrolase [Arcticibacter tournemirensis]KAA8481928.1 cellulase family glycosylhydrolase [Arcticibacter tournemirensis]TQM52263.1 cellulase (glycosyl hydrolase family 5) [Arcticibacter tournemirensis]